MIDSDDLENNMIQPGTLEERTEDAIGPSVSPARLANYWGVHVRTVYRDIAKGALKAFRLPGGQIRIKTMDARRYGRPIE